MGGMLLIALGVILLLTNFGVVSTTIFPFLWHFWPALLILAGLKIMASGSRLARAIVEVIAVLLVMYILLFSLYATSPATRDTLQPFAPYFPHTIAARILAYHDDLHIGSLRHR